MTPIQKSILSIIEDIIQQHETLEELLNDSRYIHWSKHIPNKKKFKKMIKEEFTKKEEIKQKQLSQIPRYF